jgi:hypothetical protein
MDATVLSDVQHGFGRPSRVVPIPRRWDHVSEKTFSLAMVANKPGHQEERGAAVNTIAQGMSMLRLRL